MSKVGAAQNKKLPMSNAAGGRPAENRTATKHSQLGAGQIVWTSRTKRLLDERDENWCTAPHRIPSSHTSS
eukprot:CAMPEP_0183431560 /NCGR_PEP_ID=MMETSP0370-20130417/54900_1 /TAXON_ID=268820 /ORGANISM="Peridinium aciculiferum, Strain PAER-2" /LENGTH=70 /DNA_ID=CAMNT_0025617283 /DNA_START=15 /DNA_END=223 /DNA_ORIENTATION=-